MLVFTWDKPAGEFHIPVIEFELIWIPVEAYGNFHFLTICYSFNASIMKQKVLQFILVEPHLELSIADLLLGADHLAHDVFEQWLIVNQPRPSGDSGKHFPQANGSLRAHFDIELHDSEHHYDKLLQRALLIGELLELLLQDFQFRLEKQFRDLRRRVGRDLRERKGLEFLRYVVYG